MDKLNKSLEEIFDSSSKHSINLLCTLLSKFEKIIQQNDPSAEISPKERINLKLQGLTLFTFLLEQKIKDFKKKYYIPLEIEKKLKLIKKNRKRKNNNEY